MALTFTAVQGPQPFGARRMAIYDVLFDSSYPTGGEAVTADDFGLSQAIDTMFPAVGVASGNALLFAYDATNKKIMAFYPTGGTEAGPTTVAQPVATVVPDAGAVTMTGSAAKPTLTATATPGAAKEVGSAANLSGFTVRFMVFGI